MSFIIENYKEKNFTEVLNLLNENLEFDNLSKELLFDKLNNDPRWNPENCLLAKKDNKIIGFMMAVEQEIRNEKFAFIKLMAVDQKFRRLGIARKMYDKLEDKFLNDRIQTIRFFDSPLNYYMPGVDPKYTPAVCFIEKMGFTKFGDSFNMTVNLNQDFNVEKEIQNLKTDNIVVLRARESEKDELLTFVEKDWLLWQNEINEAFKNKPISAFIAKQNGKINAFSLHSANNKSLPWFGPMGTHSKMRGKGLGSILLKLCLQDLKKKGHKTAIIPWVAPTAFYSHFVGAQISRIFWRYHKKLNK